VLSLLSIPVLVASSGQSLAAGPEGCEIPCHAVAFHPQPGRGRRVIRVLTRVIVSELWFFVNHRFPAGDRLPQTAGWCWRGVEVCCAPPRIAPRWARPASSATKIETCACGPWRVITGGVCPGARWGRLVAPCLANGVIGAPVGVPTCRDRDRPFCLLQYPNPVNRAGEVSSVDYPGISRTSVVALLAVFNKLRS